MFFKKLPQVFMPCKAISKEIIYKNSSLPSTPPHEAFIPIKNPWGFTLHIK
jgi:hypothetical protein